MAMTSMRRTSGENRTLLADMPVEDGGPEYAYGLTLNLEEPEIQKLGLELVPGGTVKLEVIARVESYTQEADEKTGFPNRSARLQITDMGELGDDPTERPLSTTLYGGTP